MPLNTNLHIYKNSCDSSKDRLDTKILSQFSKLPDKKNFRWSFLSPKNLRELLFFSRTGKIYSNIHHNKAQNYVHE